MVRDRPTRPPPMATRWSRGLVRVAASIVAAGVLAGCSGASDLAAPATPVAAALPSATPVPTATAPPTATPVPTATPTPSPTPTPTPIPVAHPCVDGMAAGFACRNVGLEANLTIADLGGEPPGELSDIWGWTDPVTRAEVAIVLTTFGTVFVDVTEPGRSEVIGLLPLPESVTEVILQRDAKVYGHHAFIVSESKGHGMQVFDLTALRDVTDRPAALSQTAQYTAIDSVHNLAIDEATGYGYLVGSNDCDGGLHIVDLAEPTAPAFVTCYGQLGYTHDVQCVVYTGPAAAFAGRQLCFAANETTLGITDVTDKQDIRALSSTTYEGVGYTHQGWLTGDQRYFVLDDEADEQRFGHPTRTRVFDVSDPTAPFLVGFYDAATPASDHNLFVVGDLVYMANYRSGLRIVRLDDPATAAMHEVGYFDTVGGFDVADFLGAFGTYPFFSSGTVVVSSREEGLFVLTPDIPPEDLEPPPPDG